MLLNAAMDEDTSSHWEQIADRCFDRAYREVLRQGTPQTYHLKHQNSLNHYAN